MSIEPSLRRRPECLSDLALDEWLAGEGSEAERECWRSHADACTACRDRRERRQTFNERYLASSRDLELATARAGDVPSAEAARGAALAGPVPRGARRAPEKARAARWLASGALAAAAGVALLLSMPSDPEPLATRTKGSSGLDFYVKSGAGVRRGAAGEVVRAGDALRFVVPRAEARYLVVLGRDSRDASSVYFPSGPEAARVPPDSEPIGAGLALPSSVVLDDAPGVERFYGVFCEHAVPVPELRRELAERGRLAPRAGCEVVETHVVKTP